MPKHSKKRELDRRPMGINISNGNAGVHAYQLYYISYSDGSSGIERGRAVHVSPGFIDLNGTKAEKKNHAKYWRPDLHDNMKAAYVLLERIGNACWDADADVPAKKDNNG